MILIKFYTFLVQIRCAVYCEQIIDFDVSLLPKSTNKKQFLMALGYRHKLITIFIFYDFFLKTAKKFSFLTHNFNPTLKLIF